MDKETPAELEARRREILRRCAEAWGLPAPVQYRYLTPQDGDLWLGMCIYGEPQVVMNSRFFDSDLAFSERTGRLRSFFSVYVHECAHWLLHEATGIRGHNVEFAALNVWLGLQLPEEAWQAAEVRTPGTWISCEKEDFYCVSEELDDLIALRDKAIRWAVELHREHPGLTASQAARLLASMEAEEAEKRAAREQRRQAAWEAVELLAGAVLLAGVACAVAPILRLVLFPFSAV